MMMITCRKRKAQQSKTKVPSKNPHQNLQQEGREYEGTSEYQNPITIPYLPIPVVFEILSRLRIKTLFSCRLVCKSWAYLISTPEFAQLHLSRSPTSCLIECLSERLDLVDLENPYNLQNKLKFVAEINLPNVSTQLTNSCNGLVCLFPLYSSNPYHGSNIYVCNPILREYITVQKPSHIKTFHNWYCAFGFSPKTNQYKVISISYNKTSSGNYRADIYTLGEGSWRSIVVGGRYFIWNRYINAFVNGALHWLPNLCSYPLICCFDFDTEQFGSIPEPYEFSPLEKDFSLKMRISVLNGNLSICDYTEHDHIDIWVMKEYGVKESWSKDIVINHTINRKKYYYCESMMITGSGEVLVIFNRRTVMLYDPKSKAFKREVEIEGFNSAYYAIAHVPSLISLKDVAKGENLKVLGKATKA